MNIKHLLSMLKPNYVLTLVYMLQASEYQPSQYLQWFWRTRDFDSVMYRKKLDYTLKALLLSAIAVVLTSLLLVASIYLMSRAVVDDRLDLGFVGVGLLLLSPLITAYAVVFPLLLGTLLVQKPKTDAMLSRARTIFAEHPGVTIAVAGSYGKTSTKEVLKTVLGAGMDVAATQANLNTPIALARFATELSGKEDILIVELGEFKPGDIAEFAELVQPDAAVITGLTEAHLDTLGDLDTAAGNLLSLADYVPREGLFINVDSDKLTDFTANIEHVPYGQSGAMGWEVSKVKTTLDGTTFDAKKGKGKFTVKSQLLGEHTVGMLVLALALAKEFKLPKAQIEKGLAETAPFEHRLQISRRDSVTVIDDTYNGNIDGVAAGVAFVKSQKAKRKVYVTPGLVEMGDQADEVNKRLGEIVGPVFDTVVLMKNAQTDAIVEGLHATGFSGETTIVDDPLEFYNNLDSFLSDGDLVLMQNDLPDNYQ